MSTTTEIQNVVQTEVATEVSTFDRTSLVLVSDTSLNEGKESVRRNEYILASGDDRFPLTVRSELRLSPDGNGGLGMSSFSIRQASRMTEIDDTSGEVLMDLPVSAVLAFSIGGVSGYHSPAMIRYFLANLWTLSFDGLTAGVPKKNVLDNFKYGIPEIIVS
jgi:hypothetical protein